MLSVLPTPIVSLRQTPCPQAGETIGTGAPLPTHFPPPKFMGIGSAIDIAEARARAMESGIHTEKRFNAAQAAAALVAPMRATLANTTWCKAAMLQYEFANTLLPSRSPLLDVFESLLLDVECGVVPPSSSTNNTVRSSPRPLNDAGWDNEERNQRCGTNQYTVDSRRGNDRTGTGTWDAPYRTIAVALQAIRKYRSTSASSLTVTEFTCIVLRGGTHFLSSTVNIGAEDSALVVVAAAEDTDPAWISGGIPLLNLPPWQQYGTTPGGDPIWMTTVPQDINLNGMPSLNSMEPLTRLNNAQFPNYDIETQSSEVNGPWGGGGAVSEWIKPALFPLPTVFWKDLTGLKNDSTMDCYNHYSTGTGGPCLHWKGDTGGSGNYFCGNSSDGGWVEVDANMEKSGLMLYPLGMVVNTSVLAADYNNKTFNDWIIPSFNGYLDTPTLTVWMGAPGGGGGWYNNRFAITGYDSVRATMNLSLDGIWPAGGWQGGRTWHTLDAPQGTHNGPLIGGSWHVNGIFQELDAQGEYFFNSSTRELFFIWNTSLLPNGQAPLPPGSPPPASLVLVAPQLEVFFNITGTPQNPVQDVSFIGLGFRDQRDGMLEDWMVPSGGDWALRRAGLITFSGTERASVVNCSFVRTDGTAIHIDKYARNATIEGNEFVWLGMSAVTLQGDTVEDDATGGTQPWGTVMSGNLVHEIGIIEKQSSALFLSKSAFTRVENNVFFNGPRAMVNVNDYMGGGDNFTYNAMWNTCRESGDHGPMNSWNRMPFATRFASGGQEASYRGLHSETSHSFIFANYGGSQAFDNDDGSAFFYTHDNAFYQSDGFKMDYGGHDSIFANNVVAVRNYDGQSCLNEGDYEPGYPSTQYGNVCILPPQGSRNDPELVDVNLGSGACTGGSPSSPVTHDNSYYTVTGRATVSCGNGSTVSILDIPPPVEQGATVGTIPDDDTLISWFRSKLFS